MRLKITRNRLSDLMSKGASAAPKTSPLPIVQHARLVAEDGALRISSTDLSLQAEAVGEAAIEVPGSTTVDANKLNLIVNRLPRDSEVSLSLEGSDLIVKSGRSRLKLGTLPVTDWPALDALATEAATFDLTGAELNRLLAKTSEAARVNASTGRGLDSVFLHCRDWDGAPRLAAVGTNGHIAVVRTIDLPEGAEAMPKNGEQYGALLSLESVAMALRMFKGSERVTVTVGPRSVEFADPLASLTAKVLEGTYPDYMRIIPAPSENRATIDRYRTQAAVTLLETFSDRDQGHKVECGPGKAGLIFAVEQAGGGGEGHDEVDATIEGAIAGFGVSSLYLKNLLDVYTSALVTLFFGQPGAAILMTADDEPDTVAVLMPMRVSGDLVRRLAA